MDLYIVLGCAHGATESDIKRAYRRLARRFHPDINPGDRTAEARFRQILDAYETLIDPDRRSRYDAGSGVDARTSGASERLRGVRLLGARRRSLGDVRRSVRRGAERARRARRRRRSAAPTCIRTSQLSFEEALRGRAAAGHGDAARDLPRPAPGTGRDARRAAGRVTLCQGTGRRAVGARAHGVLAQLPRRAAARGSSGRGRASRAAAPARKRAPRRCRCGFPPGIADGDRVRVPGKGNAGRARRAARRPVSSPCTSRRTRCSGARATTCTWCVPIAIHEAALGARIEIPHAGRRRAAARAAGHAVGTAVPAARARRAVDARRPPRRPGRRGAADAAEAARRALEGAAARVRPDQRRERRGDLRGRWSRRWRSVLNAARPTT